MARQNRNAKQSRRESVDLVAQLKDRNIERVKIGGFDLDGILRGKYVSLDKLASALEKGFGFCDVIFGWDVADALYDNVTVTGWHTGYPDTLALLDPDTLRTVPWEPGVAAMLCDFHVSAQQSHPACPRSLLKRIIKHTTELGFEPRVGVEYEFFLFRETRDTIHQKAFKELTPLDQGMFGYSWMRTGQDANLMQDIWQSCQAFGIELEGLHTETGPGVYEAAIRYNSALEAADQAALFKTTLRQVAHRHGLTATFMAKCDANLPGASGHLHQSLWRGDKNAFFDGRRKHGMSDIMRSYIAGQLQVMRAWTCLYSPTVNSYKRYVPGLWAPLVASWGVENRTCAVRVVSPGDESALHVEYRQTAADLNPYVAIAASLGAGLWGIEQQLRLSPETVGDPGHGGEGALPTSLREAVDLLAKNRLAREILGQAFVEHYVATRDWEARQFERAVTDWERQRYFETV
jgi:glutamine synthetase